MDKIITLQKEKDELARKYTDLVNNLLSVNRYFFLICPKRKSPVFCPHLEIPLIKHRYFFGSVDTVFEAKNKHQVLKNWLECEVVRSFMKNMNAVELVIPEGRTRMYFSDETLKYFEDNKEDFAKLIAKKLVDKL